MVENAAGLIVAAGDEREREMIMPLTKIGSISLIKRIVLTFQQANISLILVVTGSCGIWSDFSEKRKLRKYR